MVSKLGRTRTLIGICGVAALVALVSAGVVMAQVQRPAQGQGLMGGPGMRGMGPMGQGPGPMMRGRGPLAPGMLFRQLGVTDEQRVAMRKIHESHRSEVRAIADQIIPARRAVMDAVESGDEAAIRDASGKLGALMTEGAVLRGRIHAEVLNVLTPEQKEQATKLRAEAEQRMNRIRDARKKLPLF